MSDIDKELNKPEDWEDTPDDNDDPIPEGDESDSLEADSDEAGDEDQEDEDVDARGVSWKNVAKETQRKLAESERAGEIAVERERLLKEVMKDVPTYHAAADAPAVKAEEPVDPKALWAEGKQAEAIGAMIDQALDKREGAKSTKTLQEKAIDTKTQLLTDYPELADKSSPMFKEVLAAVEELKAEWTAIGLNVDPAELSRKGLTVVLEKQAVDRVVAAKPSYRKPSGEGDNVADEIKKKAAAGAGIVAEGGGKPSGGRKKVDPKAKVKLTEEQARLRAQYGLSDDPEKQKRMVERQARYDGLKSEGRKH